MVESEYTYCRKWNESEGTKITYLPRMECLALAKESKDEQGNDWNG